MNLPNIPNVIFSPELGDGPLPYSSQTGPLIDPLEPEVAPVNLSPSPGPAKETPMNAISGRLSSSSSAIVALLASAGLTQSLANKLKARLPMAGLIPFRQTWKEKVTQSGRRYWAH